MYLQSFFGDHKQPNPCASCQGDDRLDFEIRMAFQPIVDSTRLSIYGYEALVRGANGEGAGEVIGRLRPEQLYRFDQTCRVKAIETAARLQLSTKLSINAVDNCRNVPADIPSLGAELARNTTPSTRSMT